jgi:hypothetical protein
MKRQCTYEKIIGQKLNGLTPPDITGLWNNMEAILDREMPQQQKKKRPAGAWWFSANMLIAAGLFAAAGTVYTIRQVAGKEPLTLAQNEVVKENSREESFAATAEKTSGREVVAALQNSSTNVHQQVSAKASLTTAFAAAPEPKMALAAAGKPETEKEAAVAQENVSNTVVVTENHPFVAAEALLVNSTENAVEQLLTASVKEVLPVTAPLASPVVAAKQKRTRRYSHEGFAAGLSLNLPVALGQQQKLDLDREGKKNQWQDYVPSVYAQWHLNKKFYLQAEWQPVVAQYTPGFTLYNRIDELNPDEKMQKVVKLNKLFYTSLPVSVHYNTPVKNLTVGVGMQYSKTGKIILQDQEYYHLIGVGGVFDVTELKNEVVVKDPKEVRKQNTGDVVDSVASSFRREDWRILADVGYKIKGFNIGVRYTQGLNNYINTNFTDLPVKDRNESLQLYLRFNLFDSRKK